MNVDKKIFDSKKYFLYAFKRHIGNENKILYKKFLPSIREVLLDYIDIYEDVNKNIENKKLQNAKNDIIKSSIFFIEKSIFYTQGVYKEELDLLIDDMKNIQSNSLDSVGEIRTYNKCKAIIKKISNNNLYTNLSDIAKQLKSFSEVDRNIECMISEMLYDGYSLKYIGNWYTANIGKDLMNLDNDSIDVLIDKFKEFHIDEKEYKYYITIKSNKILEDKIYLDYNIAMKKEEYESIALINEVDGKDAKSYLSQGQINFLYSTVIKSRDYYKGLELLIDSLNSYIQMINYLDEENEITINDKIVVKIDDGKYEKLRKVIYDDVILFNKSEIKELEDIKDFMKYREKLYSMKVGYDQVANIQRAINIIKGQQYQTKENRLINLWSVLEYMLTFHNGNNIISKVKDIVPKVYCLYLIKDKINIFWNILYKYKSSSYESVDNMINFCKSDVDEYRYDLNKFIKYLNSKGEKIVNDFEFNDLLKRSILEIGSLFFDKKLRLSYLKDKYEEIEMDLVRIYRDRNILIHSGRRGIRNINYKTLRLYQYNNNILSVIIYYKNKTPMLTIEEILNSIEYTYNKYLKECEKKLSNDELVNICRPKYLFIE
ncbi:hypothetical protein C0L85_12915 [Clostridium perfringens]|uniref:hypothetical protein n=1 Tax=Clostridium perfringens TaxID=1502 RepID=UPI000D81D993|nr:hypothetical protein [Clostridium perfringens]MDK0591934.1 hypothetical protein [Clostridium perfringens]SQB23214.1 Uncharacterised protein [Clostridium perfringens]